MSSRRCIVIGIGNPDRGDDAVGRMVARRLRGVLPPDVEIFEEDGEATALLALLEAAKTAVLIDACVSGAAVGTIRRFDATKAPLPREIFGVSTHGFGPAEAIELARALGQLPERCLVYAIEGASYEAGEQLSPAVAAAIAEVAERLSAEMTPGKADVDPHQGGAVISLA